jgi:hypothetical protein
VATPRPKRLMGLIGPFIIGALCVGGYWLYWSQLAEQIETQVRAALAPSSLAALNVTGFPYRLTLEVTDLKLEGQGGLAFAVSTLSATATPFNPRLWVLEGARGPVLTLPNGPARPLKATNLKASLRLEQDGGVERFSVTFDGLEALGEKGWRSRAGFFHMMAQPKDNAILAVVADIKDLQLAQPLDGPGAILGQTIQHVFVSGPIDQAPALTRSVRAWRDSGGKMLIKAGELVWGPVSLTKATGEISMSSTDTWQATLMGQAALKPEGIAINGLSAPISLKLEDGRVSLSGLAGIALSNGLR